MALVDSLLSAIVRLDGDALVMHVGEKPYVVTSTSSMNAFRGPLAWGQVELSSKTLTADAVGAMLDQLLPAESRRALEEVGAVEYELPHPGESGSRFIVIAARGGDDIWLEIRHQRPAPAVVEPAPSAATPPSVVAEPAAAPPPTATATVEPPRPVAETAEASVAAAPVDEPAIPHEVVRHDPIKEDQRKEEPRYELAAESGEIPRIEVVPEVSQETPTEADVEALLSMSATLRERAARLLFDDGEPDAPASAAARVDDAEGEEIAIDLEAARLEAPPVPILPVRAAKDERVAEPPVVSRAEPPVVSAVEPRPAVVVPLARVVREAPPPVVSADAAPSELDRLLQIAAARGASALYTVACVKPIVRVDGEMQTLFGEEPLTPQTVESFIMSVAPEPTRDAVRAGESTEWICDMPEVGRVRCLSFRDHRGPGVIFRMLPPRAISAEQLGLSKDVQALSALPDGIVLVAGPRSSGKSTLMSAFVDLVNRSRSDHVVTIESQIIFLHERHRSFVSQREVRGHADEVAAAVRAAVREDPDVLVIEDLRSADVIAAAVDAAEAGRLVFGGVPASTASQALERLIDQFPAERRGQIQTALSATLRGVVAQVLLRKRGGGRVAAREFLLNTTPVAAIVGEGKLFQLPAALESGRRHGMVALNDALTALVRAGTVDPGEAYRKAVDRDGLVAQLKREGVDTSFVERLA